MAAKSFKRDPMKTKTGKTRLGPLNLKQLNELLKNCRSKHKMKIERRISTLIKYGHKVEAVIE
jgi:hypothetical protein